MKLYVGTYGKYNGGSIDGKWLDLADYADKEEFLEACAEVHKDEKDPEFMFQDWEGEGWEKAFYSESGISEDWWEVREALEDSAIDDDIFSAWIDLHGDAPTAEEVEEAEDSYIGKMTAEEYAEEMLSDCYDKLPEIIRHHINYAGIARDMELNGEIDESNGYLFRGY